MFYDERNNDYLLKINIFYNFKCKKVILIKMLKIEFKFVKIIYN